MAYRRFTDSRGINWRVWDVIPTPLDRRLAVRRIQVSRVHHPERRVLTERRLDMRSSRLFFPPSLQAWLCFESPESRRRLSPVPADWMTRADAGLEALCEQAEAQAPATQKF
jgi:hypothetical protein